MVQALIQGEVAQWGSGAGKAPDTVAGAASCAVAQTKEDMLGAGEDGDGAKKRVSEVASPPAALFCL